MNAPATPPSYAAFLSYRHAPPDRRWAAWLLQALETYRVPKRLAREGAPARRIGRVFRDEEELSAASDLSATIREALAASGHLVVICSPRTPASAWVNREIEYFRETGRADRVIALLVEGEPDESFPPALRALAPSASGEPGGAEPLAADARPRPGVSARQARRTALLRILARLLDCRYDDLRQRDHARRQRFWMGAAAAASVLAVGVSVLALVAVRGRSEARQERDRARALGLTQASAEVGSRDPSLALLLAREAHALHPSAATMSRLRQALVDSPLRGERLQLEGSYEDVALSPRGDRTFVVLGGRHALFLDEGARLLGELGDLPSPAAPVFGPDGTWVACLGPGGGVVRWDRDGRMVRGAEEPDLGEPRSLVWAADSLWTLHGAHLRRLSVADLRVTTRWSLPDKEALSLLVAPDGEACYLGTRDGRLLSGPGEGSWRELARQPGPIRELRWQVPGKTLLAGGGASSWHRHDLTGARPSLDLDTYTLAASPAHGLRAVHFLGDGVAVQDDTDAVVRRHAMGAVRELAADATGPEFLAVLESGEAFVLDTTRPARSVPCPPRAHARLGASALSGTVLALGTRERGVLLLDVSGADLGSYGAPGSEDAPSPWSADGRAFLSVEGRRLFLRGPDGDVLADFRGAVGEVRSAAMDPAGGLVVAGEADGHLTWWKRDGSLIARRPAHEGAVTLLRWDPTRVGRLLTGGADGTAAIWEADGSLLARLRGHPDDLTILAVASDGTRILTSDGRHGARLWDGEGRPLALLALGTQRILRGGFFAGSTHVALVGAAGAAVFDGEGGVLARHASGLGQDVGGELTPSGHLVLFGRRLRLVDAQGGERRQVPRVARGAGLGPEGRRAVVFGASAGAELWAWGDPRGVALLGHQARVTACALDLAGGRIATGTEQGALHLWSPQGRPLGAFGGSGEAITRLHPSPDGTRLLAREASGRLRLHVVTEQDVLALAAARSLRPLSPEERATYGDLLGSPDPDPRAALVDRAATALERNLEAELGPEAEATRVERERGLAEAASRLVPEGLASGGPPRLLEEIAALDPERARAIEGQVDRVVRTQNTQRHLAELRRRLEAFRAKEGRYPTAQEGLLAVDPGGSALSQRGIESSAILDGWFALFLYVPREGGYDLSSAGPDGRHHTADDLR